MSKPWDETWVVRGIRNVLVTELERGLGRAMPFSSLNETESMALHSVAALIAAAPAMARLLCRLEWSGLANCRPVLDWDRRERALVGWEPDDDGNDGCPCCGAIDSRDDLGKRWHVKDCQLDAALTAAGIDAAERERVRD